MSAALEGTTEWMRSDGPGSERCLCCEGRHVFAYHLGQLEPAGPYGPAAHFDQATDWLHQQIMRAPEGARLRITVEVLS